MGGKPKDGRIVVGGVVSPGLRDEIDEIARSRYGGIRSRVVEVALIEYVEKRRSK